MLCDCNGNIFSINNLPTVESSDEIDLNISPMKKLSGMSREEILSLRKKAIEQSIFATKNYSPNLDVYQIYQMVFE